MDRKKKTYKTKTVNIIKLNTFYNSFSKDIKKEKNGKRDIR